MQRLAEKIIHIRILDNIARVHDNDPVSNLTCYSEVVSDQKYARVYLINELLHQSENLSLRRHIKSSRWFICDQYSLPHPARELEGVSVNHLFCVCDSHLFQYLEYFVSQELSKATGLEPREPRRHVRCVDLVGPLHYFALKIHTPIILALLPDCYRLGNLVSNFVDWIETSQRLLEYHRNLRSPEFSSVLFL